MSDRDFWREFALREPDYGPMLKLSAELGRKAAEQHMAAWDAATRDIIAAIDAAFGINTDHDAAPEAKAAISDSHERPLTMRCQQTGESRCAASGSGSGTGSTQEPVAWAIQWAGEDIDVRSVFSDRESAERHVANYHGKNTIVPLYRHPQPTLTDAEREAVKHFATVFKGPRAATLRGLLERLA